MEGVAGSNPAWSTSERSRSIDPFVLKFPVIGDFCFTFGTTIDKIRGVWYSTSLLRHLVLKLNSEVTAYHLP